MVYTVIRDGDYRATLERLRWSDSNLHACHP